jgi:heme exporter protein D
MSYLEYVIGAYAVFAAFLAWDFAMPRLRLSRTRRAIARRATRDAARAGSAA